MTLRKITRIVMTFCPLAVALSACGESAVIIAAGRPLNVTESLEWVSCTFLWSVSCLSWFKAYSRAQKPWAAGLEMEYALHDAAHCKRRYDGGRVPCFRHRQVVP